MFIIPFNTLKHTWVACGTIAQELRSAVTPPDVLVQCPLHCILDLELEFLGSFESLHDPVLRLLLPTHSLDLVERATQ